MASTRLSILSALAAALFLAHAPHAGAQQVFESPAAAAQTLIDAAKSPQKGMLDAIFGPGAQEVLSSGDADVDHQRVADFLALAEKGTSVVDGEGGRKVLVFGGDGWHFPIPLAPKDGKWTFDLAAGRQEIRDRAIGRNELAAIGACQDYVDAQKEYFSRLHDDEPVQQFARRLISTPGRHDGLWWPPADATDRSPLGDRIAAAAFETGEGRPRSYKGYVYRILTRQGPDAPGGAYDYLVGGRLLAGFALLAYPETWGETGLMSFLCDQRGQVYQRNLGPDTTARADRMRAFDPGPGWEPLQ